MRDVIFELGTEEMPHTYILGAIKQIEDKLPSLLEENGVVYDGFRIYATPRRLAIYLNGVEEKQATVEEEVKGPPVAVAYKDGQPTKALEGFLKKNNATVDDVFTKKEGKKEYVYIRARKGGAETKDILPSIFIELISSLRFPKMMKWGEGKYEFGRPVRWIIALYGDEVLPISMFGLQADRYSRGLRIFAGDVKIDRAEDYVPLLEEEGIVIPNPEIRKDIIRQSVLDKASSIGGVPEIDEDLLDEVNYLVEYPSPFVGKIEEEFLRLPEVVVITVMKHHQRYFPVRDKEGRLLPYFIGVRNGPAEDIENVIKGNERVIRARLYDAVFFFEEDKKRPLGSWRDDTATIPFFEDMGSYLDKSERVKALVDTDVRKQIAHLMYADLPTNMVREFTELHGYMGKEYYKDEDSHVAQGILDTIFPLYGEMPQTEDGAYVGLMDRLDTLAVAAIKGIKVRGGGDIFGIRRAGMGIITLLDRYFPHLVWKDVAMKAARQAIGFFGKGDIEEVYKYMTDIVSGRFRGYFDDVSYEALAAAREGWETRPFGAVHTIARVLDDILTDDKAKLEKVAFGHKRIKNILKGEEDLDADITPDGEWEERLYTKAIEVSDTLGSLNFYKSDDVKKAIEVLMDLADILDEFFEEVLVNHKDETIRKRRKSLLKLTGDVFETVARFDKLGL